MNISTSSKRSPRTFFLLVFALSIPLWLIGPVAERSWGGLPFNLPASAIQFLCPLIAALILVQREDGRDGVRNLLRRIFDLKKIKHKIWYGALSSRATATATLPAPRTVVSARPREVIT